MKLRPCSPMNRINATTPMTAARLKRARDILGDRFGAIKLVERHSCWVSFPEHKQQVNAALQARHYFLYQSKSMQSGGVATVSTHMPTPVGGHG